MLNVSLLEKFISIDRRKFERLFPKKKSKNIMLKMCRVTFNFIVFQISNFCYLLVSLVF